MWMPRQRRLKLTVRSRLLGDMPNGTFVLPKKNGRSRGDMRNAYRAMIHNALKMPEVMQAFGLTE